MQHLFTILLGLIVAAGLGYFVGYDHGFENATVGFTSENMEKDTAGDAAQAMANIIGMWQSSDDPKFIREIRNDGVVIDRYEGSSPDDTDGLWMVFTKEIPDAAYTGTIEEGAIYLSIAMSESEKLYFKIAKADGNALELVYLEGNGMLSFQRVK